jgi:hypothetical protein
MVLWKHVWETFQDHQVSYPSLSRTPTHLIVHTITQFTDIHAYHAFTSSCLHLPRSVFIYPPGFGFRSKVCFHPLLRTTIYEPNNQRGFYFPTIIVV